MAMDERMDVDSEDDEIVASYDIFVKPQLENGKKIYILQFPNRDARQGYSAASSSMPLAVRMKPKSGLMELDVPIETFRNYDREKGIKWGEAVRKSDKSKGNDGGSLGLAGGFGIGAGQPRMRGKAAKDDDFEDMMTQDELLREFERSVGEGRVLGKQTLGGQSIPKDKTTPQYMIGTFRGDQLHLMPVDQIVQMRPQFHHIDAQTELERGRTAGSSTGAGGPRSIHMTVKPTGDGDEDTTDTMAERIRAVQEEPWRKMAYVDEDSQEAWESFSESLFVEETDTAPKLRSSMSPAVYMDTVSAPRAPEKLAKLNLMRKRGLA